MIIETLIIAVLAFSFTYLLTPCMIRFTVKNKLVDKPSDRGVNLESIPIAGGLAFAIPIIAIQVGLSFYYPQYSKEMLRLAISGFFIMLLGYLDDIKGFTANYKLVIQIIIVSFIYFTGLKITLLTNPFGPSLKLGFFSFPFTIAWFLLVINAFNLIDGLDGLASGIAMIVSMVLIAVGLVKHNYLVIMLSTMIMTSNFAFLFYNFYPAKIFMGDTGSLFLGLNIAAISATGEAQYKGFTAMTLLIPFVVLLIPISDTVSTIFRRVKKRKHIFQADKEHFHHKMLELGYSQKAIALIGYFLTFVFGIFAFGLSFAHKEIIFITFFLVILFLVLFMLIILKKDLFK